MPRRLFGDRIRDQRLQLLIMQRIERNAERALARELTKASKEIVKAWQVTGQAVMPLDHQKNINQILNSVWRASIQGMASRVEQAVKGKSAPAIAKNEDAWNGFFEDYLFSYGAEKVVQISETTVALILFSIKLGLEEGLGQDGIAKSILSRIPIIGYQRAALIARTETHSAANYGSTQQAKATGLEMAKEWIAASDARTRDTHRDADGQTVLLDEPFIVGGDRLMYPGDPSGSAREVINCRCTQGFIVLD